jgi:hypothetical protein
VRGDGPKDCFTIVEQPRKRSLAEAIAAYRAGNHQMLFGTTD